MICQKPAPQVEGFQALDEDDDDIPLEGEEQNVDKNAAKKRYASSALIKQSLDYKDVEAESTLLKERCQTDLGNYAV